MFNITTGYPVRTGDSVRDFEYLYSSFCSLLDELSFVIPSMSGQVDSIGVSSSDSTNTNEEG